MITNSYYLSNKIESGKKFFQPKKCLILSITMFLLMLIITGCNQLIANYDSIIDTYATELQMKVETFLVRMERVAGTPEGEYDNNKGFYDEIKGTLSSLSQRAETIPKNEIIVEQLQLLDDSIEKLRLLHEQQSKKGLTKEIIGPVRDGINSQFISIIKLENALKRGN